ncbi:MAG: S66 peptidase family protein [Desulfosalsimonas sp.]
MTLQCPASLQPGDRVGIVAPASPFDQDRFEQGIKVLEQMGYYPVFDETLFRKNGYFAGTSGERANEIQAYFAAPDIKALWCARGGYGSLRLLPELDYRAISRQPKIFIGCSDITALLTTLHARCGMVTFHGPMVSSLSEADQGTLDGIRAALCGTRPVEIQARRGHVIRPGRARGPVIGGNLATLCHLLATPYAPDFRGCILFIEDTGEKPYRIDRMLTQMDYAGCFAEIRGLAAGSFTDCGRPGAVARIFEELFADRDFPVITGFPAGHGHPNMTLPIGAGAALDSVSMSLTYDVPAVCLPGQTGEPDRP